MMNGNTMNTDCNVALKREELNMMVGEVNEHKVSWESL